MLLEIDFNCINRFVNVRVKKEGELRDWVPTLFYPNSKI